MATAITTIGPFTTPFTVPDWCKSPIISCGEAPDTACGIYTGITCAETGEPTRASECFPGMESRTGPVMTSWLSHGDWSQTMMYSPAVACPDGMTSACEEGSDGPRTVICCGHGFSCERGYCISSHYDTTSPVNYCLGKNTMVLTFTIPTTTYNIPIVLSRSESVPTGNDYVLTEPYATGLQVGLVVEGTSGLGTWSSEPPESTSSEGFEDPNGPPSGGGGGNGSGRKKGMSSGARIGIGVAVPVVIIILASIFAFICVRRRKGQGKDGAGATAEGVNETGDPASAPEVWVKPELQGYIGEKSNGVAIPQKAELQGTEGQPPAVPAPVSTVQDSGETAMVAQQTQYSMPEMAAAYHRDRPELYDQGSTIVEAGTNQREQSPELHGHHSNIMELSSERGGTERAHLSAENEGWRPQHSEFSQNPPWTQTWPTEYGTPNSQLAEQPTAEDTRGYAAAKLEELEAKKVEINEKLSRARQMEALEAEQERIQAEIEALKQRG